MLAIEKPLMWAQDRRKGVEKKKTGPYGKEH